MLRSMTGIGVGADDDGRRRIHVEIRSVNHRHLKLALRAPNQLAALEADVETALRRRHQRGAFNVNVTVRDAAAETAQRLDLDALVRRVAELHAAADRLRTTLSDAEALELALKLPGALAATDAAEPAADDGLRDAVLRAVERASEALLRCRADEGDKIEGWLRERLATCAALRGVIGERMPEVVRGLRDRFVQRLNQLLAETKPGLVAPEETALREAAVYAERTDVAEELDRLGGHLDRFAAVLKSGVDAGRQLDFLAQEMLRETNTIGSKASDLAVAHRVVDLKTEIEKIKEQVQNLE